MTIIELLEREFEFINEERGRAVQFMEEAKECLRRNDQWSAKSKLFNSVSCFKRCNMLNFCLNKILSSLSARNQLPVNYIVEKSKEYNERCSELNNSKSKRVDNRLLQSCIGTSNILKKFTKQIKKQRETRQGSSQGIGRY